MGIFKNNNKEINEKLNSLNENLESVKKMIYPTLNSHPWESIAETNRKADILAHDVAMMVGADNNFNSTTYNDIQNMKLPSYMSWDYWVMINQWADYWVNRYSDFKHPHKEEILTAIRIAILFGLGAVDKETFEPYYVSATDKGKYVIVSSQDALNSTAWSMKDKKLNLSEKVKTKTISIDKLYVFTWRFNNIGDYVWCMKQLLTDIYIKKILECNTSFLTNKVGIKVKNPKTLPTEIKTMMDPYKQYFLMISDEGANLNESINTIIDKSKFEMTPHIEELILAHKQHQEYYYNLFGRVITSSKNQTLSSDANLNVSSAELVAEEHDRRIVDALEVMGIHIIVNEIEQQEPQNQNADKEGEGIANTDMSKVKEKV